MISFSSTTLLNLNSSQASINNSHRFSYVHTLRLNNAVEIETLAAVIDIDRVEHLTLCLLVFRSLPNVFHIHKNNPDLSVCLSGTLPTH